MMKSAARNFLAQALSLGISFFDRIVVVALLVRSLGVDAYADWVSLGALAGLLGSAEFGVAFYFGNALQRAHATGDEAAFQRLVGVALGVLGAVASAQALAAAILLSAVDLSRLATLRALSPEAATLCAALLCAAVVSRILRGGLVQIYRGRGQYARGALVDLVAVAAVSLSAALVALAGSGPTALALAALVVDLVFGWGVVLIDIARRFGFLRLQPRAPHRAECDDMFACLRWSALYQACAGLLLWAPPLILGAAGAPAAAVVAFTVMRTLVNLGRLASGMVVNAIAVELTADVHLDRRAAIAGRVSQLGRFTAVATAVMAVAGLWYGAEALLLWTGRADLFERSVLAALFAGAFAAAVAGPLQTLLAFANAPRTAGLAALVNAAIGLPLAAAGAAAFGAAGLAFGLAAGEVAASVVTLGPALAGRLPTPGGPYALRCIGAASASGLWCAAVATGLDAAPMAGAVGFAARIAGFAVFAAVPALLLAVPVEVRRRLDGFLRARVRGNR